MNQIKVLYLTWQDPDTRSWHVVGRLFQREDSIYGFNYTKGSLNSNKFTPFSGMDDLKTTYFSTNLFPLFLNRILPVRRPEYPEFIKWLGFESSEVEPIDFLERSGGLRETDNLQVFKKLQIADDGTFFHTIFVHGIKYLNDSAKKRIGKLSLDEELYLCLDVQNQYDESAVIVRAGDPAEVVGYCPRYISSDVCRILKNKDSKVSIKVEAFSETAPVNYRLMCKLYGYVSPELKEFLMNGDEYQPIGKDYVAEPSESIF
jgi:hypothetical protein